MTCSRVLLIVPIALFSGCIHLPRPTAVGTDGELPPAAPDRASPADAPPRSNAELETWPPAWPDPIAAGAALPYQHLLGTVRSVTGDHPTMHHGVVAPDARTLALLVMDDEGSRLSIRETRTGTETASIPGVWSGSEIGLAYSPDSRWIAVAQHEGHVSVISVDDGRVRSTLLHTRYSPPGLPPILGDHPEYSYRALVSVAFSRDGRSVLSTGEDGNVILWDWRRVRPRWIRGAGAETDYPPVAMQGGFLPDGRVLIHGLRGLEVLSPRSGEPVGSLNAPIGEVRIARDSTDARYYSGIIDFAVSRDGALVAVHGRTVEAAPARGQSGHAGDWIQLWWWEERPRAGLVIPVPWSTGLITISPDHRWIAAVSREGIHVWDTATGGERFRIPGTRTRPIVNVWNQSIDFGPDGRFMYTFHNHERPVLVWDLEAGQ